MRRHQLISLRRRAAGGGNERGVALVEFALVLPLLLTLAIGVVDFGRAFNYWIDQTHLANEAARWAVVNYNPGDPSNAAIGSPTLQSWIKAQADSAELRNATSGSSVCVRFPNGGLVGEPVEVTVKFQYTWLSWMQKYVGLGDAAGQTTIGTKATMRLEATPSHYSAAGNITSSGTCT